ncbi:type IV pilus assembly protein PilN [Vibrio xiamenensis]|uniref:Type IV pilus assembly protein PilN n=1 Tax=Vibrio xiamenensis TaxID=861298 RepID=A0A1G8BKI4_9VIBR|nr:PilN domain-containing protein [Vibrio xiamenensis]SDH33544.1 type IV pilus assembly protein PilN [Vibrio xiamenensis]
MLDNINLLPWREMARRRYKRQFWTCFVAAMLVILLVVWGIGAVLDGQVTLQNQRVATLNQYLRDQQSEQSHYQQRQQRYQLLNEQLQTLQRFHHQQHAPIQVMTLLTRLISDGVYLDKLEVNRNRVSLAGISDSTQNLTSTVSQLESNERVAELKIHRIEHDSMRFRQRYARFELSFTLQSRAVIQGGEQ